MKRFLLLLAVALQGSLAMMAQIVTTSPAIVQTDSENIVITFHADEGNKGLMGQPSTAAIYAHTGVITSESANLGDWKHAPTWLDNAAKYKMTYAGPNTWTLTIPSIDAYYGLNPGETVEKLMFVFRNATGTAEGKTAMGGDIAVDVYPAGFFAVLSGNGGSMVISDSSPVEFNVATTAPANIKLYLQGQESTPIATANNTTSLTGEYAFTTEGDYVVMASATPVAGGETKTATLPLARIGAAAAVNYPGGVPKMGPVANPDGSVTFCIAAPKKSSVVLVSSADGYKVTTAGNMNYQDYLGNRYFWTTISGINPRQDFIYYFLVDGMKSVGDPYARLVLDPWSDKYIPASVFPNMPAYPVGLVPDGTMLAVWNPSRDEYTWTVDKFQGVPQSELMIYELLIRDFTGTEGSAEGNGTIQGVLDKLDYLEGLNINAIELMPIMEFNGNNSWGYNPNFYFAPDKAYGTPYDYRRLIDACHRRGIAVIIDVVFNQSDGLHPWYQMYDIVDNPFYNGSAPHAYSVLNDWNQDSEIVQQQWYDVIRYWMTEYKVDGFRFDLVKGLGDNSSYGITYYPATNTFATPTDASTNAYNASRIARMKKLHDVMLSVNPQGYFINENLAGADEENAMASSGEINWANLNGQAAGFAVASAAGTGASMMRFYAPNDSRTWGSTVSYAESHDEERVAYFMAQNGRTKGNTELTMRRLGAMAAQMILSPGAHMIWQFEEFGADQTTKNSGGNDTSPKTVVWNYLNDQYRNGLRKTYADLIGIRYSNPEMFRQGVTTSISDAWASWTAPGTIKLTTGNKEIVLIVNGAYTNTTTARAIAAPLSFATSNYKVLACSYGVTPELTTSGSNTYCKLPPNSFAVYGTNNLAGIDEVIEDTTASKVSVYGADNGTIVISGEYTHAAAFDVTGNAVPMTGLIPGIYIVRVDGISYKVLVR